MKKKKAVSGIVGVVILIALVMVVGAIVWGVVANLVEEKLEGAGSCIDVFEKLSLNGQYTCIDSSRFPGDDVIFSISRGDIDLDSVIVLISYEGVTNNFKLTSTGESVSGLQLYNGTPNVWLPGKNEGLTYVCTTCTSATAIEIAPVVGGKQCSPVDSMLEIPTCLEIGGV